MVIVMVGRKVLKDIQKMMVVSNDADVGIRSRNTALKVFTVYAVRT